MNPQKEGMLIEFWINEKGPLDFDTPMEDIKKFFNKHHPKEDYVPAYEDTSEENLVDGWYCRFCARSYYTCLCSHEG